MPLFLCLDFDGVIHSYTSGWKGVDVITDPPVPGAQAAIERYLAAGFTVVIYSSRSKDPKGILAMREWMEHYFTPEVTERLTFAHEKPAAFLTIDDRAICFKGQWPSVDEIKLFKPWYKR